VPRTRRQRAVLYSTPFIALSLFLAVYYVVTVSPVAQEDYTLNISIQISYLNPRGSTGALLFAVYPRGVGLAGGVWQSHQFDTYGMDGRYPIFGEAPPGWNSTYQYYLIHVRSRFTRTYTLFDFFNVWGQPLGRNNTLSYTVPPQNSNYGNDWYWDMCVRPAGGTLRDTTRVPAAQWTSEPLDPGLLITLIYSNHGCL